jgi:hypothetical protein
LRSTTTFEITFFSKAFLLNKLAFLKLSSKPRTKLATARALSWKVLLPLSWISFRGLGQLILIFFDGIVPPIAGNVVISLTKGKVRLRKNRDETEGVKSEGWEDSSW